MLQLFEEQIVRHGIAKSDAFAHLKTELTAPFPHNHSLVLRIQDLLGQYLFFEAPRKLRCSYEIESVVVKQMRVEIGRHGDQAGCSAPSAYQGGHGLYVVELRCCLKGRSYKLFV